MIARVAAGGPLPGAGRRAGRRWHPGVSRPALRPVLLPNVRLLTRRGTGLWRFEGRLCGLKIRLCGLKTRLRGLEARPRLLHGRGRLLGHPPLLPFRQVWRAGPG